MKPFGLLIIATIVAFSLAGCRKDRVENGPFAIEAKDFLTSKKYEKLQVEVCYVDGHSPKQESLDQLKAFLESRLNKPGGITFKYKIISSPGQGSFDQNDLEDIEKNNRTDYSRKDMLVAFVFFADAPYSSGNVLGLAYGSTSCAIFEKTVEDNSGGFGQPTQEVLETTVLEHEFGHLIGLVDNGTDMVTAHASDGHHCNDSNCLMYYAVETLDFIGNLVGGEVPQLDAHCIADLQANGGK